MRVFGVFFYNLSFHPQLRLSTTCKEGIGTLLSICVPFCKNIQLELDFFYCRKIKVRQIWKDFFKPTFLPQNEQANLTLLLVDLFSFVFWKKVKTLKRHFEINWPLAKRAKLIYGFFSRFSSRYIQCSAYITDIMNA